MNMRNRPNPRATAAQRPRAPLTIVFTLMILLGSLASPLLPSVAAATLANDARMDQQQADLAIKPGELAKQPV